MGFVMVLLVIALIITLMTVYYVANLYKELQKSFKKHRDYEDDRYGQLCTRVHRLESKLGTGYSAEHRPEPNKAQSVKSGHPADFFDLQPDPVPPPTPTMRHARRQA